MQAQAGVVGEFRGEEPNCGAIAGYDLFLACLIHDNVITARIYARFQWDSGLGKAGGPTRRFTVFCGKGVEFPSGIGPITGKH